MSKLISWCHFLIRHQTIVKMHVLQVEASHWFVVQLLKIIFLRLRSLNSSLPVRRIYQALEPHRILYPQLLIPAPSSTVNKPPLIIFGIVVLPFVTNFASFPSGPQKKVVCPRFVVGMRRLTIHTKSKVPFRSLTHITTFMSKMGKAKSSALKAAYKCPLIISDYCTGGLLLSFQYFSNHWFKSKITIQSKKKADASFMDQI